MRRESGWNTWSWRICLLVIVIAGFVLQSTTTLPWWALAALALVFAIFRLNPAPFCVLDEVDAPLDDANVNRFCNLVKELSQQVQFIYITHNKLAMTMATDLLGVTMPEAGSSKLVAVSLAQAEAYGMTE